MDDLNDDALLRYSRHLLLPQIDLEGQRRIAEARVLIVGAGGLGSPVALYLASAGVGQLTVADGDTVELGNLQRQVVHDMGSLARNKAESAAERMRALNPDIRVNAIPERLDAGRLAAQAASYDVLVDCSDNFATRHAVNRAAVAAGVPLVSGAAVRFEGQLAVFDARRADSPCYACLFPEGEGASDGPCATFGVFAPLVGVIGSLQACETLKLLIGMEAPVGTLTLYDAIAGTWRSIGAPRDQDCPVCGGQSAA